MHEYLLALVAAHPFTVYFIIVLIAAAEGPLLSLTSGALLFAGYFRFFPLYLSLMLGDLIGDVVWYFLGYHYGHRFVGRFGKYFKITEEHISKIKEMFRRHRDPILFISKTTNGLGLAILVLFTAGLSRIPFLRYISINTLGQLIWSGMLIGIGYYFSNLYVEINTVAGKVFLVSGGVVIFVAVTRYLKYFQTRIDV